MSTPQQTADLEAQRARDRQAAAEAQQLRAQQAADPYASPTTGPRLANPALREQKRVTDAMLEEKERHEEKLARKLASVFTFSYSLGADVSTYKANVVGATHHDAREILVKHLNTHGVRYHVSSGTEVVGDCLTSETPLPAQVTPVKLDHDDAKGARYDSSGRPAKGGRYNSSGEIVDGDIAVETPLHERVVPTRADAPPATPVRPSPPPAPAKP